MKRNVSCRECGFDGMVDYPAVQCPKCESENIDRCVVVECCGEDLFCPGFTNTCNKCGADYNWAGQLLASRSQWGEETGESVADILAIDGMTVDELFGEEDG